MTPILHLPPATAPFINRRAEVDRLTALLSSPSGGGSTVVVSGPGGVGKSALAIHVAHRLRERYPDAQLYAHMRGEAPERVQPETVLAMFLEQLGVPSVAIPSDLDGRATLFRAELAKRKALVVLDDAHDEAQVRPLLSDSSTCAVLITSRSTLSGLAGAQPLVVDLLNQDASLQLLGQIAGEERLRRAPEDAAKLVEMSGGLPLTLRIIGGLLAGNEARTLAQVDELLREGVGSPVRSVRGALALAYDTLDPAEARVLRRMAAMDGPEFSPGILAALDDSAPDAVERALNGLVVHGLLSRSPENVYRMHDLIKQFARDLLVTPVSGSVSGAGNDTVGDVDQLGFQHYVDAFADLITSPFTRPPLTIGIFGSWGMGKSFLLEHICREVGRRQPQGAALAGPRVHIVKFNAWEYNSTETVWPGLVRKIVRTLDEDVPWPRRKRAWTRVRWNLPRELRRMRAQIVASLLVVVVAIIAAALGGQSNVATAIGVTAAALTIGGVVKAARDSVARWVTALASESTYGGQLAYMDEINHDLRTLEGRLHEDGDSRRPVTARILILIDDLDRCEPAKAVEVLQAINLLLNFSSFIVCLGIDARIVTGAIERHYEGLLDRAGASGYEYLDKIVQIPFRIPEPNPDEVMAFVTSELGNPERPDPVGDEPAVDCGSGPGVDGVTGPEAATQRPNIASSVEPAEPLAVDTPGRGSAVPFTYEERVAFEALGPYLRPNPRHLKRLVNVYRLVRALAYARGERLLLEQPAATIRWLVMWGQWPYTAMTMIRRFEELLDDWHNTIPADAPVGDPVLRLLDDVEASLDAATLRRHDDDIGALRELLSVKGCALTWEEIRRIRRYTVNFNPAVEEQMRDLPRHN